MGTSPPSAPPPIADAALALAPPAARRRFGTLLPNSLSPNLSAEGLALSADAPGPRRSSRRLATRPAWVLP